MIAGEMFSKRESDGTEPALPVAFTIGMYTSPQLHLVSYTPHTDYPVGPAAMRKPIDQVDHTWAARSARL